MHYHMRDYFSSLSALACWRVVAGHVGLVEEGGEAYATSADLDDERALRLVKALM